MQLVMSGRQRVVGRLTLGLGELLGRELATMYPQMKFVVFSHAPRDVVPRALASYEEQLRREGTGSSNARRLFVQVVARGRREAASLLVSPDADSDTAVFALLTSPVDPGRKTRSRHLSLRVLWVVRVSCSTEARCTPRSTWGLRKTIGLVGVVREAALRASEGHLRSHGGAVQGADGRPHPLRARGAGRRDVPAAFHCLWIARRVVAGEQFSRGLR